VTLLLLVLPVCNYHTSKGKVHSSQGKKQNEASLSGSNFINLCKKGFLAKKSRFVMRTVIKMVNIFVYNSRTGSDI
jgi:hypothetical protein